MKDPNLFSLFGRRSAVLCLPTTSEYDNKSTRGRSLLFAGSKTYPGAGILAARASARMGSGYTLLAAKGDPYKSWKYPDFLLRDAEEENWKEWPHEAVLVGPGFGVDERTLKIIQDLKYQAESRVVLDADALSVCAKYGELPLPPHWIVTPHEGELARCLNISSREIADDRQRAFHMAVNTFGCVVVLKGHETLIGNNRRSYRNGSGNSALAKAGTGDVLAGMITSLRAQGLRPLRAALLGVYLHGAAADYWVARGNDPLSLMASDIVEVLPKVLHRLRSSGR